MRKARPYRIATRNSGSEKRRPCRSVDERRRGRLRVRSRAASRRYTDVLSIAAALGQPASGKKRCGEPRMLPAGSDICVFYNPGWSAPMPRPPVLSARDIALSFEK